MKTLAIIVAASVFSPIVSADQNKNRVEALQTGRYTYVKNIPLVDQLNPLKVIVDTKIPQSISTVGQAVEYLLVRSGYVLADAEIMSEEALALLALPLPHVHRKIGPMTLDQALRTLSGDVFALVVDPIHRKIVYEVTTKLVRSEQ